MAKKWFYVSNGQQYGPVSSSELKRLADEGKLLPSDLVWKEGAPEWIPASKIRKLFDNQGGHIDIQNNESQASTPEPVNPPPPPTISENSTNYYNTIHPPTNYTSSTYSTHDTSIYDKHLCHHIDSPESLPPLWGTFPIIEDGQYKLNHRGGYLLSAAILLVILFIPWMLIELATLFGLFGIRAIISDVKGARDMPVAILFITFTAIIPLFITISYIIIVIKLRSISYSDISLMRDRIMSLRGYTMTTASYSILSVNLLLMFVYIILSLKISLMASVYFYGKTMYRADNSDGFNCIFYSKATL